MPRIQKAGGGGSGNIVGTTGTVDKALTRASGTGGATLQGSPVTLADDGTLAGALVNDPTLPRQLVNLETLLTAIGRSVGVSVSAFGTTTANLPTYTYANGVGNDGIGATMTATANGAFPTLDGTVQLVANDPIKGVFLNQNGSSAAHNGPYLLTQQGDGSTPWIATRVSTCNTAGTMSGSVIGVASGVQSNGAQYIYKALAAITVGVTLLYWKRRDSRMTNNEGIRFYDDLLGCTGVVANNLVLGGPGGLHAVASGTGAAVTAIATTGFSNASGLVAANTGTVATSFGGIGGDPTTQGFTLAQNVDVEIGFRFGSVNLSTAAQEYALNVGLIGAAGVGQVIPANGICFLYDRLTSTNIQCVCSVGGVSTKVDSGIGYNAGQLYRGNIVLDAGSGSVRFYIDGAIVATINTNIPFAVALGPFSLFFKSAGIGLSVISVIVNDYVDYDVFFPNRRAA